MAFSPFKVLKSLLIRQENTTTPREVEIVPGGSASTKTTIESSQTANRTLTLPDATDTLVGRATTDTLTNKIIDADVNIISNIEDNDIKASAGIDATKIGNGDVDNTELSYVNGVTSSIQTQLNSKQPNGNYITDLTGDVVATGPGSATATIQNDAVTTSKIVNNAITTAKITDLNVTTSKLQDSAVTTVKIQDGAIIDLKVASGISATKIADGSVSNTEFQYLDGVTSAIQTQLDGKEPTITALPINKGGTGQTTQTDAFDALAPSTTKGDIIVHNGTDNVRLPVGIDGNVLVADSTQSSGVKFATVTGVKNYITNDGAESTVNGWVTYADAAHSRPVDGTGGTANVTITRSTTNPLRGVGSFVFTKDAANRQGEGASYDFTIDSADRAKVLNIVMDWTPDSGTFSGGSSSTDSDLIVYLYDVTNARLIEPAPIKLDGAVNNTPYKFVSSFQTNIDSTSYRLIVHVATTSTTAYTVKFDAVTVSPSVVTTGAYVGDWVAYTPTFTGFGTVTAVEIYWRRVGDSLQITGNFTTGTNTAVEARISLPNGLVSQAIPSIRIAGTIHRNTGAAAYNSLIEPSTGYITFANQPGVNAFGKILGSSFNNSEKHGVNAIVPIAGWGTSQVLSSETDTRVVASYVYGTPAAYSAGNPIIFPLISKDTHGAYNTTTGRYLVPVSGFYEVKAYTISNNAPYTVYVSRNGSGTSGPDAVTMYASPNSSDARVSGSAIIYANAGDFLDIRQDTAGGTVGLGHCSFVRISGPSQIAASETVALIATGNPANVTGGNPIIYPTVSRDSHGGYNPSTGQYRVPISGLYQISASALSTTAVSNAIFQVYINGTVVPGALCSIPSSLPRGAGSQMVYALAGQLIDVRPDQSMSSFLGASYNSLQIVRVGN